MTGRAGPAVQVIRAEGVELSTAGALATSSDSRIRSALVHAARLLTPGGHVR
jgi:hypothetical protein